MGVINGDKVLDVTEITGVPTLRSVNEAFQLAEQRGSPLNEILAARVKDSSRRFNYEGRARTEPGGKWPYLLAAVDHPNPYHALITGTGLTHFGSAKSRDEMHVAEAATNANSTKELVQPTEASSLGLLDIAALRASLDKFRKLLCDFWACSVMSVTESA